MFKLQAWKPLMISAFLSVVVAQTPVDFNVTASTSLEVVLQPSNVTLTASRLVSQEESLYIPWIYLPSGAPSNDTYLAVMIDSALPILQWMQPNLVNGGSGNLTFSATTANASTAVGASYIYPQPPVGQLHEYIFLLYEQPQNWTIPTNYSTINPPSGLLARLDFQIADFQNAAGLDSPIAANYMRVLNSTAEASSSLVSATETALTLSTATEPTSSASASTTTEATTSSSTSATASDTSASASATSNVAAGWVHNRHGILGGILGALALAL